MSRIQSDAVALANDRHPPLTFWQTRKPGAFDPRRPITDLERRLLDASNGLRRVT